MPNFLKVLIGSPTYEGKDYCLPDFAKAINSIVYPNKEVLFVDNSDTEDYSKKMQRYGLTTLWQPATHGITSKKMAAGCNYLRDKVIKEKFDFLYMVEVDMIVRANTLVELMALYRTISDSTGVQEKVVGSLYRIFGGAGAKKCAFQMKWDKEYNFCLNAELGDFAELPKPFLRVSSSGLGSVLIPRSVLEKIKFKGGINATPDKNFFDDLTKNKIDAFIYTKEIVEHQNVGDWYDKTLS